nr:MAG TPA: hypothetical protein [Caudoviricetes sp.]
MVCVIYKLRKCPNLNKFGHLSQLINKFFK